MQKNYQFIDSGGAPIKAWINGVPVESGALDQVKKASMLPFVHGVALMPDVHIGIGSTVGSVVITEKAIVPAMVGVDIGCGMCATRTSLTASDLPDSLLDMRLAVEAAIPHGRTDNGGVNDRGAWGNVPEDVSAIMWDMFPTLQAIFEKHPKLERGAMRAAFHLGTLGTGNHYLELCLDKQDRVWVMLHSGSRGIGNQIGQYFITKAKEDMAKWFISLPDQDLAYLVEGNENFDDYVKAVSWAQDYAAKNREIMLNRFLGAIKMNLEREFTTDLEVINCHHNYVARERHMGKNVLITRKGAVRAREGDMGIIPGSMGARSFIVRGLGNHESFHSCSHGAGRVMSRTAAKKTITLQDHINDTQGIECRKDIDVIDESPRAYKDIQAVMDAQSDLVEIVHELHQVMNVKG